MNSNKYTKLEDLYKDHRRLVYAFIADYSTEEAFMEEIASTVWMKVWEKADFFLNMEKAGIKYYLREMVKTAVSDYFRCIEKENKKIERLKEERIDSNQFENNIEALFLENIGYYLREAISVLSKEEQYFIVMRFKHNQSMKDIGNYFGITEGNARVRQSRILTKMKKKINELMSEERNNHEYNEK